MYIKIWKTKKFEKDFGKWIVISTLITQLWLYKDDGTWVKWIKQEDWMIEKIINTKIDVTIPEIQHLVKEHEIDKLLPKSKYKLGDVSLFW